MRRNFSFKKIGLGAATLIFFVTVLIGPLLAPAPAQAQWAVTTVQDIPAMVKIIADKVKEGFWQTLGLGAIRSVSYFMRKVAYDSTVWLASGAPGQSPLANTKNFGDYLKNTAGDAAMEGIAAVEDGFKVNLCGIPDIKVDLAFRIGLRTKFNVGPPAPTRKCSFQDFKKNWGGDAWKSKYGSKDGLLKQFNASLDVRDTDFGIYLDSVTQVADLQAKRQEGNLLDRQEGQGIRSLTDKISGAVLTPGQLIKKEMEAITPSAQNERDQAQIAAVIGSGFFQILPATLATFLDTLAKTMFNNFMTKGMFPFGLCVGEKRGPECSNSNYVSNPALPESQVPSGLLQAQATFSGLLKPNIKSGSGDSTKILGDLNNCPESPSLYNCRADVGIISALNAADFEPITIKKALYEKDWLHKDWRLYGPERIENDISQHCFDSKQAYCYTNIKVLRQLRILPLGFELAALMSPPDKPWTLADVVAGYDDCHYNHDSAGNITGVNYDPVGHPFCHLIDPNWVIKLPPTQCRASVFGSQPVSPDAPYRVEECVDSTSCVAYDNDGNCTSYGYCAREKNTWDFGDAKKCDPYYASCLNFTDSKGASVSYLKRTLDTGNCNSDTVGCSAYSLTQNSSQAWRAPVLDANLPNYNTGIHFNANLSSVCSANSAGCTAFRTSTGAEKIFNYRLAPDYLGCYDSSPATPGVQWPASASDLSKIVARPECADYAKVCIAAEAGCNEYTDVLSGDKLPAKFTPFENAINATTGRSEIIWNDQCDGRCVGYDAYREMPSNYSNGVNVAYLIPKLTQTCTAEEEGCSGFTNMNEISAGGGEQVEYFSLLRSCIKPDPARQKNFYTYESTADGGYQLKSYILEQDPAGTSDPVSDGGNAGGPKYFAKTPADLARALTACDKAAYDARLNTDCRQFNDDQGHVYYRLLAQVIPVSNDCTPYRLNSTEFAAPTGGGESGADPICFQGGRYSDGFCYYDGLPGGVASGARDIRSQSCSAAKESCRQYKGNTGNNIRPTVKRQFEEAGSDPALHLAGFTAIGGGELNWSLESIIPKEHSLSYSNTASGNNGVQLALLNVADGTHDHDFEIGAGYAVSFWAKGNSRNNLIVSLNAGTTDNAVGEFSVSDVWRLYRFNVSNIVGNGSAYSLKIVGLGSKTIYLDNLQIVKNDNLYLVKKSINVPTACDSSPADNLPGEALGCREYSVPNSGTKIPLRNFSYLCRQGAVGCTGLLNTYNTLDSAIDSSRKTVDETAARAYQVRLYRTGATSTTGGLTALEMNSGQTLTRVIDGDSYSCVVPVGETGCYVKNIFGHSKGLIEFGSTAFSGADGGNVFSRLVASSYYIPSDATAPIYLVASEEASCQSADLGCTYAGLKHLNPSGDNKFDTVLIKNDPATYDRALCAAEAVGCNAYMSGESSYYFKDPVLIGQKVCSYESETVDGVEAQGWFWKDVGLCAGGADDDYCSADSDCAAGVTCNKGTKLPCYPDYALPGNVFGLYSYGDTGRYNNFVGECTADQSGCTAYIDHSDNNAAKYLIENTVSVGDCAGQVSRKEGCALFEQADNPSKLYDTKATYLLSDSRDSAKVPPVVNPATNDANVILRVSRNRECGEWLACQSSHPSDDGRTQICDAVGRCNQAPERGGPDSVTNCANFVDSGANEYYGRVLTPALYQTRLTNWANMDFSGYSLAGMYQADELVQLNLGNNANPDWRLVRPVKCGSNSTICKTATGYECKDGQDDKPCGNNTAVCKSGMCVQTHRGDKNFSPTTVAVRGQPAALKPSCRAYQAIDSPFVSAAAVVAAIPAGHFCDEGGAALGAPATACECDYTQVSYGEEGLLNKYFNYLLPNKFGAVAGSEPGVVPSGICQGGDRSGAACGALVDCPGGACQLKKQEAKILGWHGYCLEPDYSRPTPGFTDQFSCLTWLPITNPAGFADANSQHLEAGYVPSQQLPGLNVTDPTGRDLLGQYYCMNSRKPAAVNRKIRVVAGEGGIFRPDADKTDDYYQLFPWGQVGGYWVSANSLEPDHNSLQFAQDIIQKAGLVATIATGVVAYLFGAGSLGIIPAFVGLINVIGSIVPDSGQSSRMFWLYPIDSPAIYQSDIEYVKFTVDENEKDGKDQATSIYVYPNVYNGDKPYMVYNIPKEDENSYHKKNDNAGIYVVGNFMAKRSFPAFFYSSKTEFAGQSAGYINDNGEIQYKSFVYKKTDGSTTTADHSDDNDALYENVISGNLFGAHEIKKTKYINYLGVGPLIADESNKLEPIPDDSLSFLSPGPDQPYHLNGITYDNVCPSGHSNGGENNIQAGEDNWHGVVMQFDTSTKKFMGFWMYYCDQSGTWGQITYNVQFKLRDQCRTIADTRFDYSGQSAPWTNRLWEGNFIPVNNNAVIPPLTFNSPYAPYGSLNIKSASDPYQGNTVLSPDYLRKLPLYVSPSASRPGPVRCFPDREKSDENCVVKFEDDTPLAQVPKSAAVVYDEIRLRQLFAKSAARYLYNSGTADPAATDYYDGYTKISAFDLTDDLNLTSITKSPHVSALGNCNEAGNCLELLPTGINSLSVNDKSSGLAVIKSSPGKAVLKFFAHANENQMPLRSIWVDWGDGKNKYQSGDPSFFRNRYGYLDGTCVSNVCQNPNGTTFPNHPACTTDDDCKYLPQCVPETATPTDPTGPLSFGRILDRTCDDKYYRFDTVYECSKLSPNWKTACSYAPFQDLYNGCCEFKPKVQVRDNWGWCNGSCGDPDSPGGTGCYGAECSDINNGAAVDFEGTVIVPPRVEAPLLSLPPSRP